MSDPIRLAGAVRETAGLSDGELRRYARHLLLPEIGREGQEKLKAARVLAVGAGGLGSPLALYLAAAGVGTLGVVDFDFVDESNLQRQILFGVGDVGRAKPEAAAERLRGVNPELTVIPIRERLASSNALDLIRAFDVVADGTDNFPTRYLVNDACVLSGKPNVYASIYRFEGQASVFAVAGGPCYRCLHPQPPPPGLVPSCAEAGVLGVLPGLLGVIQAAEAVKLILGKGESLSGRLLMVDVLGMRFREIRLARNPDCAVCGDRPTVRELVDYEAFCEGRPAAVPEITVEELDALRRGREPVVILDVREPPETALCAFPDSIRIPLGELPESLGRLSRDARIVVHCKTGARSARAVELMIGAGFRRVWNLAGGIDRWSDRIDPTMPRY